MHGSRRPDGTLLFKLIEALDREHHINIFLKAAAVEINRDVGHHKLIDIDVAGYGPIGGIGELKMSTTPVTQTRGRDDGDPLFRQRFLRRHPGE